MRGLLRGAVGLFLAGALIGCSSLTRQQNPEAKSAEAADHPARLPYKAPEPPVRELDEDLVFSALAGEIALQHGDFELAYRYQMQTALLAGDAAAAERASLIAEAMKREQLALDAVTRWVEFAPNDLSARQLAARLFLDAGRDDEAFGELQAIVAISDATGEDGYLAAVTGLAKAKRRPEAIALLRRLGAAHGDDRRAGYALALLAMMWKDYAVAESEIRGVLAREPDWGRAYFLLSRIKVSQGDVQGGIKVLRDAIRRLPDDRDLNAALARVLVEAGDYEAAYQQFLRARRLDPEDTDVVYSLGVLAMQLGKTGQAKDYFQQLEKQGVRSNDVAYYLGRIAEIEGRLDDAVHWYHKVDDGGFLLEAQLLAARVMAKQGQVEAARSDLQSLRIRMPEKEVQLFLLEAGILRDYGDEQQVFELYRKALQAHPDDPELLYARGLYAAQVGRMALMERDLRKVISMDPANADALNALGYTFADQTQRFKEALSLISRALRLKPDSPAILDSMGWLQYRMGNYEQSLVFLRRAYSMDKDGEIAAHLGEVLWMSGDYEGARQVWREALETDPENAYVRRSMKRLTGSVKD